LDARDVYSRGRRRILDPNELAEDLLKAGFEVVESSTADDAIKIPESRSSPSWESAFRATPIPHLASSVMSC